MAEYPQNLILEGIKVLNSRIPSGNRFLHDQVEAMKYHRWVLHCLNLIKLFSQEHADQIKVIYNPEFAFYHQAEKIFGIVQSAVEFIQSKRQPLTTKSVEQKSPDSFIFDFLNPILIEKCADLFYSRKYDDCILNAASVVEVAVQEATGLSADLGVNLMRKAFKPDAPILKYSDNPAEQESVMRLFSGFISVFKTPYSPGFLGIKDPLTAFKLLTLTNNLLNLVRKVHAKGGP